MREITDKQKCFADEYLKDNNATQAAIRAGYSAKTAQEQGSRLLSNVIVEEYLDKRRKELQKKTNITQEWVLKNLKKVFKRCMQEEAVRDKDGNFTGVFDFAHSGANRSLELIGKHLNMFTDSVKLSGDKSSPLQVEHLTTDSVKERIQQLMDK